MNEYMYKHTWKKAQQNDQSSRSGADSMSLRDCEVANSHDRLTDVETEIFCTCTLRAELEKSIEREEGFNRKVIELRWCSGRGGAAVISDELVRWPSRCRVSSSRLRNSKGVVVGTLIAMMRNLHGMSATASEQPCAAPPAV